MTSNLVFLVEKKIIQFKILKQLVFIEGRRLKELKNRIVLNKNDKN